ncbi:hypothetical protein M0638_27325 [Roseomonas sp. NAR14]|uniref:Uncharacterized protein n=1 Tax=Roseomonas acroporae TaxID=2937791 RepID=A0A9X1YG48_9PROT|nr:hypothetical protein [Roseomonas acroporae]MCK8788072.1 hypothetical protein [Roseomonas acroporae]
MAVLSVGTGGFDSSALSLGSWTALASTDATSVHYQGNNLHSAGYTVTLDGFGLGGYTNYGPTTGTILGLSVSLPGSQSFSISTTAFSAASYAAAVQSGSAAALLSAALSGANVVIGSSTLDVLPAYGSFNQIDGGGGFNAVKLNFTYGQVRAAEWNGQAVVYDTVSHQLDQTVNVQNFQFTDQSLDISQLPVFQPLSYVASYADLSRVFGTNQQAAFLHYESSGIVEGRTASFDGLAYIASYADLIAAFGANKVAGELHYINTGHLEGRLVTFDSLEYIASYGDLIGAYGANTTAGELHYITSGHAEGRNPTLFNAAQYLANYADLRAAYGNDLHAATLHYITSGYAEHRTDHPFG